MSSINILPIFLFHFSSVSITDTELQVPFSLEPLYPTLLSVLFFYIFSPSQLPRFLACSAPRNFRCSTLYTPEGQFGYCALDAACIARARKKTETAAVSLLRNANSIHVNTDYPQCGVVGREVSRIARNSAGKKSR